MNIILTSHELCVNTGVILILHGLYVLKFWIAFMCIGLHKSLLNCLFSVFDGVTGKTLGWYVFFVTIVLFVVIFFKDNGAFMCCIFCTHGSSECLVLVFFGLHG